MHAIHELLGPIVAHAALGTALAALVWAVGNGILIKVQPSLGRSLSPEDCVLGYPFGLVAVVAALYLALLHPIGAAAGVTLLLAAVAPLRRLPASLRVGGAAAGRAALRAAPFGLGYAIVTGFIFHGATHDLNSHVLGDNAAWVSRTSSLQLDAWHYPDLTTLGYSFPRPEAATPIIAAALSRALPIDFYLFGAAAMPMFLVVSVAGGIGALRARVAPFRGPVPGFAAVGGLLLVGSLAYGGWIPESTTAALALPLALTVAWLTRTRIGIAAFLLVTCAVLVALVTTKILASVAVVGVLGTQIVRAYGPLTGRRLAAVLVAAATAVAVAAVLFFTSAGWILHLLHLQFVPYTAARDAARFLHNRTISLAGLAPRVAGEVLLAGVLARRREWSLLVGLVGAVAGYWLIAGQGFHASATFVVLVVGACVLLQPSRDPLLLLAAPLLAIGGWWPDPTEYRGSFSLAVLLGSAGVVMFWEAGWKAVVVTAAAATSLVALALAGHVNAGFAAAIVVLLLASLTRDPRLRVALPVAAVLFLTAGSATALVHAEQTKTANFGVYDTTIYPHEAYLVWTRVHALTGPRALVFTSQTGASQTTAEGWNYYPGIAGRQVYLAGWANSSLRVHTATRRLRLRLNHEVLAGRVSPTAVPGAQRYSGFFAVLPRREAHPRAFDELYVNDMYALYAIPG
jgi:hypothetical protein